MREIGSYLVWRLRARPPVSNGYDRWCEAYAGLRPTPPPAFNGLISVITPVWDPPVAVLERCLASVRGQTSDRWEHVLVRAGRCRPEVRAILDRSATDPRVRLIDAEGGISARTNAGAAVSRGEYLAFLDHDDELEPTALEWVATCLPGADVVYTDQDEIGTDGHRRYPFFKPAWSPRLLFALNYVNHLLCVRRDIFSTLGGFRGATDGAQDHDFLLRLDPDTVDVGHVPHVLYHWRRWHSSLSRRVDQRHTIERRTADAINEAVQRRGIRAQAVAASEPFRFRLVPNVDVTVRRRLEDAVADGAGGVVYLGPEGHGSRVAAHAIWLDDHAVAAVGPGPAVRDGIAADALARYPREVTQLGDWILARAADLSDMAADVLDSPSDLRDTLARGGHLLGIPDPDLGFGVTADAPELSPHLTVDRRAVLQLRDIPEDPASRLTRLRPRWSRNRQGGGG